MSKRHKSGLSASSFNDPLLLALGREVGFCNHIGVDYKKVLAPVMALKGISSIEEHGFQDQQKQRPFVAKWIAWSFRNMKVAKAGKPALTFQVNRGQWGLTQAGVDKALELHEIAAADAVENEEDDVTPEQALAEVLGQKQALAEALGESTEGSTEESTVDMTLEGKEYPVDEFGEGMSLEVTSGPVGVYHTDPYLVSLALKDMTCLGRYSKRSTVCERCCLQEPCIQEERSLLREIARDFDSKIEETKANKERIDHAGDALKEMLDKAVKDRLPTWDAHDAKAEAINTPVEGVCYRCSKPIAANTSCRWVRGVGLYHLTC